MAKVYISKSVDIPDDYWERVCKYLKDTFPSWAIATHEKGTPYNHVQEGQINTCDIFIYLKNPGNNKCGRGCYTEIKRAENSGRQSYLLYLRNDDTFNFYSFSASKKLNTNGWSDWAWINFGTNITSRLHDRWSQRYTEDIPEYSVESAEKYDDLPPFNIEVEYPVEETVMDDHMLLLYRT